MCANCPKSEIEKVILDVYNVQGSRGGDIEAMNAAMVPLTVPLELREKVCNHLASKGFVSIIYIRACLQATLDHLGGRIRDVDTYPTSDDPIMPSWNDYARFIPGAIPDEP